ncbi:MAG: hypothetical protein NTZ87_04300 [Candidatus Nomurabacteria bacterium]|nr:hypothetical protein [Candidatus Nomurabacteria bacterium]
MKKKFIILPIFLLILVFVVSLPCDKQLTCSGPLSNYVNYPGLWFLVLIPLSLLALTLNDRKHKFWLKFTGIFFAISMFFVFLIPETARGIMLNPDRESANWFFVGLYSFISIIYFFVQFFKNKNKNIQEKPEKNYFI